MQFNSNATQQDLVSEIDSLCDSNSTSYPIAAKTRRVNSSLEELVAEIINADGTWDYDDTNHSDSPVGTGNLVEAQEAYAFASEYLEIKQVSVKDTAGNWSVLEPIDPREFRDQAIEEYFPATGLPTHFDKNGDTIRLYPAPTSTSVTLTAGLKVRFTRTASLFTTTDTTKEPGLPSTHHVLLAYMAAIPYCATYKKDRVPYLVKKVDEMRKTLIAHFARREKDKRKVMTMRGINFI